MPRSRVPAVTLGLLLIAARAAAAAPAVAPSASPYAPYAFLVGQWDVAPEAGGPTMGGALFRWGPKESYIWWTETIAAGGREVPHFEGLLMWNGVQKNLDVLIALDLEGGRIQEKGVLRVEPDGSLVRDIVASYSEGAHPMGQPVAGPAGATARFRQIFRPDGPDRVKTQVLRESKDGWVATFPGSDHLVMTRRKV